MFTDDARINGRRAIQETIKNTLWKSNGVFLNELETIINKHRFLRHPLYQTKSSDFPDKEWARNFYLSIGTIPSTITDSVIHLLSNSIQLQPRLGIKAVYSARFLLQINLLDELGFRPEQVKKDCYAGHPNLSHTLLFVKTLSQIGVSLPELEAYQATNEIRDFYRCFEGNYEDYTRLLCVLTLFDKVFLNTVGEWLVEVASFSEIDLSQGYYSIQVSEDDTSDTKYLLQQAIIPERYNEILLLIKDTLETWSVWSDELLRKLRHK